MPSRERLLPLLLLAALLVPAWPLLTGGGWLADPLSELPVRVWGYERVPLLGGVVDAAAFPNVGLLNDPDPLGALFTGALRPLLGRMGAFNAYVLAQIAATLLATWALGRELTGDPRAALLGAVAFALTPLSLVYGVSGAVVDLLALWPWALAVRSVLRAWRGVGWRDAALAGVWAGVGFIASPYLVLVFAALAVPAVLWGFFTNGQGLLADTPVPSLRRLAMMLGIVAAAGALVAGPYALHMANVMAAPTSQMSSSAVESTRHAWPFPLLYPDHTHRYVAFLADYVAVGKGALIERVAASRFYRAFSPGLVLIALAVAGLVLAPRKGPVGLWLFCAGFAILASTGPWMPITMHLSFAAGVNPAWWMLYTLPGGDLLLEPFRYGLAAALALAMAGTLGVAALARRYGAWVPFAAVGAWVAELVLVSPVPMPLPTVRLDVPAVYAELDTLLPPGAIIELPYFDRGTDRFFRVHFFHQLVHGRPIADEVLGFPARYLTENQFTAALLAVEKPEGALGVKVTDPGRIAADRARLATDGFAGLVVDSSGYADAALAKRARDLAEQLGQPVVDDARAVWVIR